MTDTICKLHGVQKKLLFSSYYCEECDKVETKIPVAGPLYGPPELIDIRMVPASTPNLSTPDSQLRLDLTGDFMKSDGEASTAETLLGILFPGITIKNSPGVVSGTEFFCAEFVTGVATRTTHTQMYSTNLGANNHIAKLSALQTLFLKIVEHHERIYP